MFIDEAEISSAPATVATEWCISIERSTCRAAGLTAATAARWRRAAGGPADSAPSIRCGTPDATSPRTVAAAVPTTCLENPRRIWWWCPLAPWSLTRATGAQLGDLTAAGARLVVCTEDAAAAAISTSRPPATRPPEPRRKANRDREAPQAGTEAHRGYRHHRRAQRRQIHLAGGPDQRQAQDRGLSLHDA